MALFVAVDFLEIGIDDFLIVASRTLSTALGRFGLASLLVHDLAQLHRALHQSLGASLDRGGILALHLGANRGDVALDLGLQIGGNLVAEFLQALLGRVSKRVGLITGFDQFLALLVVGSVRLGILDHLFDVGIGQTARSLDADLLFLAGGLVLGLDVDDAVGVDVEGDLDLRHAARRGGNTDQIELTQHLVVGSHLALALEDADGDGGLVVLGGREHLALAGRDGGVAVDQTGEHTAQGFDAERQRGDVEQQDVLDLALQHAALDRGADSDDFIRVDALVRLAAKEFLHHFLNLGHAGHAADQDHFVDLAGLDASVLQGGLARLDGAGDQILDQGFELGTGQLDVEVLRARGVGGDEGQVDFGLHRGRQLDLGLFRRFLQTLERQPVLAQVDALLFLELVGEVIDDPGVEIFTAQEGVAVGRFDLEHAVADFQHRHVEGAAAKVIDRDDTGALLFQPIGQSSGGRLVDDAQHFKTGDTTGVLGRLTLGVVEVGRNGDHRLGDGLAQIAFGGFLHLLQDEGRHLAGAVLGVAGFDPGVAIVTRHDVVGNEVGVFLGDRVFIATTDQTLDRKQGVGGIGDRLALRRLTHQSFPGFGESHHRRGRAHALGVFNDLGSLAFHDGNARIRGAQVDADNFAHVILIPARQIPGALLSAQPPRDPLPG
ncbi:putative NAD-specific glutamate dehydrogenase [Magnetospirillum fulvum MGU-K5]|uniref:Putative NAD-specific glutamate dehydrogenase n=1 Tax=Magnetospirillum fulvum MGU-K5 TaxID=1316936 RepID=S9TIG3_MAGFU|nr:putative NAD-specific glutamate dehydrogenase [Magnetospirillum fulvum MGU-K5]